MAAAKGRRTRSGIAIRFGAWFASLEIWVRYSIHRAGLRITETATTATEVPMATASGRHSRRTSHQIAVTPGETFDKARNANATGARSEITSAAASSRWMLPWYSSATTGGNASHASAQSRASQTRTANRKPNHSQYAAGHGTSFSGPASQTSGGA